MTPIELSDMLGLGKTLRAIRDIFRTSDLKPCNTRFLKVKASSDARFRTKKVAVHRMHDGKWEANPLDPEELAPQEPDPPVGPRRILDLQ